jgi:Xaa-Pro aminopeptidase
MTSKVSTNSISSAPISRKPNRTNRKKSAVQHGPMDYTTPPTDLDEVRLYRLERVRNELRKHDYAGVLLLDPLNIRYATDSSNMQIWCMHFETRCALVLTDGPVILFDYTDLSFLVEGLPTIDEYKVMDVFYYFAAGSNSANWAEKFGQQIADEINKHCKNNNKRLAIDRLSHQGVDAIRSHGIGIFDGQEITELARAIKSPGEILLMREAIDACEQGMKAMQQALKPGITENALWAKLQATNIERGGEWIETRLLASGERTNPWFHECSMRPIEQGDMVSFDTDLIGPYGYCADISRAWVCGSKPTDEQKRLYSLAYEQVQHDIEILKPGMTFKEVAEASWPIPDEFIGNRYGCMIHGVGLADEWPSIPYPCDYEQWGYEGVVEPNMVLSVESYIGSKQGKEGVKLEQMVLITESGTELLSNYPFEMDYLL